MINRFNITKSDYEIIANDLGIDFILGAGVDMNSDTPIGRNNLLQTEQIPDPTTVATNEWRLSTIDYIESSRIEEYFKALSVSIKASYGLSSGSLNYNRVINEQQNYYMVIVLITDRSNNLPSLQNETITTAPYSETSNETDDLKTWQFLQDYGSHYINKISFGYQIAFEAKVEKRQFTDEMSFSASINAAFGAFSTSGSVNLTEVQSLKTKGVKINGRIISGGIVPDRPLTISNIDDLTTLLQNLNDGTRTIKRGPFKLYLQSYWKLLTNYPVTRNLFRPTITEQIQGDFGVPKGTIIAYYPPININIEELLNENTYYWVPDGWAICNGLNDTPDLTNRFIMGSEKTELGQVGGSVEHNHRLEQVPYDTAPDASNVNNGTIIHSANHLPPYYKLIYIVRK